MENYTNVKDEFSVCIAEHGNFPIRNKIFMLQVLLLAMLNILRLTVFTLNCNYSTLNICYAMTNIMAKAMLDLAFVSINNRPIDYFEGMNSRYVLC